MTEDIRIRPFEWNELGAYSRFAERAFHRGYQSEESYLRWLYDENPVAPARWGFHVACVSGNIVGCVHRLGLEWLVRGESTVVPAIHNLMVEERYRKGAGLMLILASTSGCRHAFVPGVGPELSPVYEKLGYQQVDTTWFREVLAPIRGAASIISNRALGPREFRLSVGRLRVAAQLAGGRFSIDDRPSDSLLGEIAARMNEEPTVDASPAYSADVLRWRFFHPLGPRHILIHSRVNPGDLFAVVSLGERNGAILARCVSFRAGDSEGMKSLLLRCRVAAVVAGAHILQIDCAPSPISGLLRRSGARTRGDAPKSFFFHRRRREAFSSYRFTGLVGDFGLEAIKTRSLRQGISREPRAGSNR